ncbi:DMT family transporter [Antrihabitans stalactiti]|uniref:DMT family transporter n=1 Tax=Antrihabitans stalactiti TaxID=2584121 RepID=UPI0030B83568
MTELPSFRRRLGLLIGFMIGLAVVLQARINGALGGRLDDGVAAATISFGGGLVLLCVALAFSRRFRSGLAAVRSALTAGTLRPWHCIGGLSGAFFIACQGITITTIGVALFTVATIGGQVASSLWVDRVGIGPGGPGAVTRNRVVGAVLALAAVVCASAGEFDAGVAALVFAILPAVAGLGIAWQQAVNGKVGAVGGPFVAAWLNFAVGTVALVVVLCGVFLVRGLPSALPDELWLYTGGALGVAFIAAGALVVRWIGVLLLGLAAVAGQVIGAVALDAFFPTGRSLTVPVLLGCALAVIAVAIAATPNHPS